jgi:proline iminopeptidase
MNNTGEIQLYPSIEPYQTEMLQVSDIHEIYVEQSGNPNGKPVIYLHGGPGAGTDAECRRLFDPAVYRIIIFDQRGCGKSLPKGCLEDNTTWALIEDMEQIREHLAVDTWQVFGGSWGSTLALAYAINHPQVITELVLRGIFLLRRKEILWFYQWGHVLFPDLFEEYIECIPQEERNDVIHAYYQRLTSDDKELRIKSARTWGKGKGACYQFCLIQLENNTSAQMILPKPSPELSVITLRIGHFFRKITICWKILM